MDPWKENPIQEKKSDNLGFFCSLFSKVVVACWCLVATLGLLWFWPIHKTVTIILTLASIVFCLAFLVTKQEQKNEIILKLTFCGVVVFGVVGYMVQG